MRRNTNARPCGVKSTSTRSLTAWRGNPAAACTRPGVWLGGLYRVGFLDSLCTAPAPRVLSFVFDDVLRQSTHTETIEWDSGRTSLAPLYMPLDTTPSHSQQITSSASILMSNVLEPSTNEKQVPVQCCIYRMMKMIVLAPINACSAGPRSYTSCRSRFRPSTLHLFEDPDRTIHPSRCSWSPLRFQCQRR